ncbi:cell division protein SepF [Limosilactobacillus sp. Sa3CUN2]|uniref:Cell division protein SepF n=1 Tax=Limosilactobacillus avistercoris TaxID=2762243 RepID=A0ABR8PAG8_9LACO|nr:cell division protein SepF [Limosilactobacillus avistercoris]MBD7894289.1 cell division protein SepF [Limosilactobacillus avistercoris]
MANNLFKSLFSDSESDNQDEYYDEQTPVSQSDNKVVSMNSIRQRSSKIALYEPRLYADVKQIADQLLNDRAVIVNFSQMDSKVASRIVDFLNGTVFAISGDIKRIGKEIFLCTPKNFEVSGNLSDNLKNDTDKI